MESGGRDDRQLAMGNGEAENAAFPHVLPVSEQILSPRRFCPPGHNLLAEIVPHGHNPLADIVPLPQIFSPPPGRPAASNRCLAVSGFFLLVSGPISPARFCIEPES